MTVVIEGLTVRYGARTAVEGLSVTIGSGAVGLLGRNGAGKSSVLRALLGLVRPAAGRICFVDLPAGAGVTEVRSHVGYMPERDARIAPASGFEMVALLGMLSGMSRRDAWRRAHEVLYLVGLEEQRYRSVSGYSAGMRQKVKLAAALVHDPKVLFLDEPTNGLDPGGRSEMLALVRQLGRELGKSVVFSTHILPDVEAVCEAAIVLEAGRVVAQGPLAELTGAAAARQYSVSIAPVELAVGPGLDRIGRWVVEEPGRYSIRLADGQGTDAVFAAVRAAGGTVRSLVPHRHSLEEVFLRAVRPERAGTGDRVVGGSS